MKLTFKSGYWTDSTRAIDKDFERMLREERPWQVVDFLDRVINEAQRLKVEAEQEWHRQYEESRKAQCPE